MFETIIKQNGDLTCPVCRNNFKWSIEVEILHDTAIEKSWGTKCTVEKLDPPKSIYYNTINNDEMDLFVRCPKCSNTHKFSNMKLK